MAEYATTLGLVNKPSFSWWVMYTLKKGYCIISLVNRRVWKCNHKFGIHIPNNIKEAISLEENNGNTLWQDAYAKYMYQVGVAFKILQDGYHITVVYKKANVHLIFDAKINFTWKARWVNNGHLTDDIED